VSHLLKARVVLAALLALTTFAAASPRAFADQSKAVTVFLSATGGNATAIAACLNVAKDHGGNNLQVNDCKNTAAAVGGDVTIKGAKIVGISTAKRHFGKASLSKGVVAVTLTGGNATAIATCANAAGGGDNAQLNTCVNTAVAIGGPVIFNHVKIEAVASA
jgi:hypothetical protein